MKEECIAMFLILAFNAIMFFIIALALDDIREKIK